MQSRSTSFRALLIASTLLTASPAFAAALTGDAYKAAEAAYAAIARGDLPEAEKLARSATALQPDSADAVRLLMDVLGRRGQNTEALVVANSAIVRGASDPDLRAARGYLLAAEGHHNQAIDDFSAALAARRIPADRARALRLSLSDSAAAAQKNDLVLDTLAPYAAEKSYDIQARRGFATFALGRFDEARGAFALAVETATAPDQKVAALKGQAQAEAGLGHTDAAGALVRTLLGTSATCDMDIAYLLMRLGDDATALATFDGRCKDMMTATAHLDAADAARRLNRPDDVAAHTKAALESKDISADRRRELRIGMADSKPNDPAFVLETLTPIAAEESYDIQARIGFAAFALERYDDASTAFLLASTNAKSTDQWLTAMKGLAQAEAALGRRESVIPIVREIAQGTSGCDLDLAYTLLRAGADNEALGVFETRCKSAMTPAAHLDAAYAARRLNRNEQSAAHFKAALDADRALAQSAFDDTTELGIKRSVDGLEREFGLSAGAFYRGDRSAAGGGSVGQGLVEAYWQPENIGNVDGKIFQVYGRVGLNALTPASAVQTDSLQGAVGVRYKPFSDLNLLVAGERLVPIGDAATKDWLLRAGYSIGLNTDIQPLETWYWTGQVYGEAAYFVDQDRFIGTVEGRYGIDARLGGSPNLLGSLYSSAAFNFDAAETTKSVGAIGLGTGIRYWFRETEYRAPSSFIQFDVMYRWKVGRSDRAAGLVLQSSLSY